MVPIAIDVMTDFAFACLLVLWVGGMALFIIGCTKDMPLKAPRPLAYNRRRAKRYTDFVYDEDGAENYDSSDE